MVIEQTDMNTAIILAGGQSSRLGTDKQFLRLAGGTLVDYIVSRLKDHFEEIIVVTSKPEDYKAADIKAVGDVLKGCGPLGGIHSGLASSKSRFSYVIACDMPYINPGYITYMKALLAGSQDAQAVITRFGNWIEPFNAFYSRELIPLIEKQLEGGEQRIGSMLEKAKTLYIEEKKAREFSPDWNMFININTRQEYESYIRNFSR
jgi:molybdopterin-guanine dinucleotide biosynthesis protein A